MVSVFGQGVETSQQKDLDSDFSRIRFEASICRDKKAFSEKQLRAVHDYTYERVQQPGHFRFRLQGVSRLTHRR
jgi:hypothetical protein